MKRRSSETDIAMKRRLLLLTGLLLGLASAGAGFAQESKPLKVFVFAGQSNMVGMRGAADELPEAMRSPNPKALFWTGEGWEPIAPGVSEKKGFGPEIAFAHAWTERTGETIGIIKHSVGGTSLATQWLPEAKNSLYGKLAAKVEAAKQSRPIEIVGMLWMQGERDSRDPEMAKAYAKNLRHLIETARKDFDAPEMVFVAGRVNPPEGKYVARDTVRAAQKDLDLDGYRWIDCDDLSLGPDNLHYDTAGLVQMGERFAKVAAEK